MLTGTGVLTQDNAQVDSPSLPYPKPHTVSL